MKRYICSNKTSGQRKFIVKKIVTSDEIQRDEDWERRLEEKLDSGLNKSFTPEEFLKFMDEVWDI